MKLLVCDVEGTIFKAKYKIDGTDYASTMWQPIAKRLGEAAINDERETHKKWENREYNNYIEWVEASVQIHKKYGLHVDVFNSLLNEAEYNEGVIEFFNVLDRKKYIPVLVSGGFQELVRKAQKDLNICYGYGACEYYFDKDTGLLASHTMTPCDFAGKYHYVNALFGVYNMNPKKDWLFIGDGKNDVPIAEKAPLAYSINGHNDLAKIVKYNASNFTEIYNRMIEDENTCTNNKEDQLSNQEYSNNTVEVEEYNRLVNERDAVISHSLEIVSEIFRLESDLNNTKNTLASEIRRREQAEQSKIDLENMLANLTTEQKHETIQIRQLEESLKFAAENRRSEHIHNIEKATNDLRIKELETQKILHEIDLLNELLENSSLVISEKELNVKRLKEECNRLNSENAELKKNETSTRKKTEKQEIYNRKVIKDFWALHFRHFSFTTAFIHEVAKLSYEDRMRLEEKLLELYETTDPRTLNRSKYHDTGYDHLGLTLFGGVAARVDYKVLHDQKYRVEIANFYKKNEV